MQIETLTATQDCRQNFLRLGRRENKFHMCRRLLERFKQRVERSRRKHVHFVDQINFVATFCRGVSHVVAQLAHVLHAVIARAVDLDDVKAVACRDFAAVVANSARLHGWAGTVKAVERLRQNACRRSFPDAARADEKICVCEAILLDRILQRLRDMILSDQIVERLRSILSRENLIAHFANLMRAGVCENRKVPIASRGTRFFSQMCNMEG
jgi:hypothetical protein